MQLTGQVDHRLLQVPRDQQMAIEKKRHITQKNKLNVQLTNTVLTRASVTLYLISAFGL